MVKIRASLGGQFGGILHGFFEGFDLWLGGFGLLGIDGGDRGKIGALAVHLLGLTEITLDLLL